MDLDYDPTKIVLIDDSTPETVTHDPAFGRGCVPRDYSVQPAEMFASPDQMPIIQRSEMIDYIKAQDKNQSSLYHIRLRASNENAMIPSLNQGQYGYCHTADTEVLTERGWVGFPDYNFSEPIATVNRATHRMEFQLPFQRHVYEYDGPMMYSTNRRLDFGVTPDHEMYVRKWDEAKRTLSDHYSFVRAGDLGWYSGFMAAPSGWAGTELVEVEVPGDRRYDGDDFFALLGLIVSDGYAGGADGAQPGKGTRNWVSFASFREETRPAIAALAARCGLHESPSRPGVFVRYDAGALAEWIRQNCYTSPELGSHNKRVPLLVKCASMRQIKHFLHYFDDRDRKGQSFYSTSRRLIDDLQELLMRIGRRSTISGRPAKSTEFRGKTINSSPSYQLVVSETDRLCIERKKQVETDRYRGLVYCAGVPNHTLLTRRNGSVLTSSNCWAHSTTNTVILDRAKSGLPYVPLSAFAIAATIKKGANEGGWCGLSAQFAREKGIPSQKLWPQGDAHYRNYDKPEVWADAARHKITSDWVDLTKNVWDENLTIDQVLSCLLLNTPLALDFNWWGHSVAALRVKLLKEPKPGQSLNDLSVLIACLGIDIWNSWGDDWGDKGVGTLTGNKMIPNGAIATVATVASA